MKHAIVSEVGAVVACGTDDVHMLAEPVENEPAVDRNVWQDCRK